MSKQHVLSDLPDDELIIFPSTDKAFHEKHYEGRNACNFPHPYRCVCVGGVNRGKSTLIKNLIHFACPPFERAYLLYPGQAGSDLKQRTAEWDDVQGLELLDSVPPPEFFPKSTDPRSKKAIVIIDDIDLKALSSTERSNLDRLYGHVSTHRNVSVVASSQDFFSVPPVLRRMCSHWIIWNCRDKHSLALISRKTGTDLEELFKTVASGAYDSVCIDLTPGTPMPLRLNIFKKIYCV